MTARRGAMPVVTVASMGVLVGAILATMNWHEPPRFDGAGYATLGRALAEGRGYRDVGHPDAPPHAHFPPTYPAFLALIWRAVGIGDRERFTVAAHGASVACMAIGLAATAWWWRRTEPRGVADCLMLALAVNWTWARAGGVIRSEPLAIALGGLTLVAARAFGAKRTHRFGKGPIALGAALGLGVLTRQVFACVALAVALDVGRRRGRAAGILILAGTALTIAPWAAWQARVGSGTQSSLFRWAGLPDLIGSQALFYARRLPDAIAGPFVEVATVFGRSPRVATAATVGAILASAVVVFGWVRLARSPRARLGGLIPLLTMPLLLIWPFTEAGRFLVPLVPFLLMGAVEGAGALLGRLGVRRGRSWAARLVLLVSLPYPAYAIVADRAGAERRIQAGFDSACSWIAAQPQPPGPVMARHPADVAWLSGRPAVAIPEGGPGAIAAEVDRRRVAFLLVDDGRYARSPDNPLHAFVAIPGRARKVRDDGSGVAIYAVGHP